MSLTLRLVTSALLFIVVWVYILFDGAASSWLFMLASMVDGKVLDRSQISTSFLTLGYTKKACQYDLHCTFECDRQKRMSVAYLLVIRCSTNYVCHERW